MKRMALVLWVFALLGCMPSSTTELRALGEDRAEVFEADGGYQRVYRSILEVARGCFQTGMITAQVVVNGDLYPDDRTGSISVEMIGAAGAAVSQVIDVSYIDGRRSRVTVYVAKGDPVAWGRLIKAWADGTSSECDVKHPRWNRG